MLAWATGCVLAAIGGILIAPGSGMDAGLLSLLIVNAYAAAIIGRLRSLPLTFVGAVDPRPHRRVPLRLPARTARTSRACASPSPAIVLFIVLLLIPNPRLRGRVAHPRVLPVAVVVGRGRARRPHRARRGDARDRRSRPSDATIYVRIFPFAIFALSLVPLTGFAGQISLCQLSFAAIGASVWAQWGTHGNPLWMLVAALVAAVIGALDRAPRAAALGHLPRARDRGVRGHARPLGLDAAAAHGLRPVHAQPVPDRDRRARRR